MSLLALDRISMRYACGGRHERVTLRDVSLRVAPGELVTVAGGRRSGRTTLLRIAAGTIRPSAGTARFAGVDLAQRSMLGAPHGIAYAIPHFEPIVGGSVLEQVAAPLLGHGLSMLRARIVAYRLLLRTAAASCASSPAVDLNPIETLHVSIARALVTAPSLLLVDQPPDAAAAAARDGRLLKLLRSIAHHDAIAIVLTSDESARLDGADRVLTLERGTLHGQRSSGRVVPLRRP